MTTAQGLVHVSGVPTPGVYYTALFFRAASGLNPQVKRWMRVVYLTDVTGTYTASPNEDNFLGADFSVQNGDQMVVLFWKKTGNVPVKAPGQIYYGQDPATGLGGTHEVGFKTGNGASAVVNYADVDLFMARQFTMTGAGWQVTVGDGDVDLSANAGPTTVITPGSTDVNAPAAVVRNAASVLTNGSYDSTVISPSPLTGRWYTLWGQTLFEQSSAAHNASGVGQTADNSPADGAKFSYSDGLINLHWAGVVDVTGGSAVGLNGVTFPGPSFLGHTKVWPHIDVYPLHATSKDDAGLGLIGDVNPPLIDTKVYFYRTSFAPWSVTFTRKYADYQAYITNSAYLNPDAAAQFAPGNSNTIRDVVFVKAALSGNDLAFTPAAKYSLQPVGTLVAIAEATRGRVIPGDPVTNQLVYSRLSNPVTMNGSGSFVVLSSNIAVGIQPADLGAHDTYGFLNIITQTPAISGPAQRVLHSYRITGVSGTGQITIDTHGSTQAYTTRDWYFISNEPGGSNEVVFDWQVQVGGAGWVQVGSSYQVYSGAALLGTAIHITGVGLNAWPGAWFQVLNGQARGWYQIDTVTDDDHIVLHGVGLALSAGGAEGAITWKVGFPEKHMLYPQRENDALNFRATGGVTTGWPENPAQGWNLLRDIGFLTTNGEVNNIPPEPVTTFTSAPGTAATYLFDGRKSYGTQTTWVQGSPDPAFTAPIVIVGGNPLFLITDPAVINTALRNDNHAWLILDAPNGEFQYVYPIVKRGPTSAGLYLNTVGHTTLNLPAGQTFRTTNNYEIEPAAPTDTPNDIASYAWQLRSSDGFLLPPNLIPTDPGFLAWWNAARIDGSGTGPTFTRTYPVGDNGRTAVIMLTVTDEDAPVAGVTTKCVQFTVDVSGTPIAGFGLRRIEWE